MTLLRGLGDREVVVDESQATSTVADEVGEGAKFVQRGSGGKDWAGDFLGQGTQEAKRAAPLPASSVSGAHLKPPAQDHHWDLWEQQFEDQRAVTMSEQSITRPAGQRRKSVHFDEALGNGVPSTLKESLKSRTATPGATEAWSEDLEDFDHDAFMAYNGEMHQAQSPRIGIGAMEGWGELQDDWERFQEAEPGKAGLRGMGRGDRVERYLFQSGNPYSAGVVDAERFGRESPTFKVCSEGLIPLRQKGVLELEAEVQHDPTNYEAWYSLGLKQQENEREDQALLALSKVVQLEPKHRPAYLALAVSYTNEGELEAVNAMIERWIELSDGGVGEKVIGIGWVEGRRRLVERLIDMARRNPDEVDAEVQVALGVLFNTSEVRQSLAQSTD